MCTAIVYRSNNHYFGRNLDLEYHYDEAVTITPRNYRFQFRCGDSIKSHFAFIGMATVADQYPLYYEATNEHGLSIAGLNFPGNAVYRNPTKGKINLAPFELIPWILGKCSNLHQAKSMLEAINITDTPFSEKYQLSPLHWLIADNIGSVVAEPLAEGLKLYNNPSDVLTNNPPFPFHLQNRIYYKHLSSENPIRNDHCSWENESYSNGMGTLGLPGDLSSVSRFVRADFMLKNAPRKNNDNESVHQFFHILDTVYQPEGANLVNGKYEITVYSSCCNMDRGVYYYTTYNNRQIRAIDMFAEDLNADTLIDFPLEYNSEIATING